MEIPINWVAVFVALVASLALAKTWYAETVFGGMWRKLTGVTPADSKQAGSKPIIITLFANIATVIVMAAAVHVSATFFNDTSVWNALATGFTVWLAFSATTLLTHNAFEQKSDKLTFINNGYQLALFLISAFVIGIIGT